MLEKEKLFNEAENAIKWIHDYVQKVGASGVVVGNSGGKDSATVIAMSVRALGKDKVLTVSMPCNSINQDFEDAEIVSKAFDVPFIKVDLSNTYIEMEKSICVELSQEAKINIKPRLRMTTLYAIAQSMNYLVIGTGNLCEAMVGYTTKWGDNSSDFNPIANFTAPEVVAIGEYLGVPENVIHKAPNDGLGGLTDEEKMGITYKQIAEYIETGKTDKDAMAIIEKRNRSSKHKREKIPTYYFDRVNYLN